jgi:hypothetical protein
MCNWGYLDLSRSMTNIQPPDIEEENFGKKETGRASSIVGSQKSRSSLKAVNEAALSDGEAKRVVATENDEARNGHEQELNEKIEDVPPNGGYGWVCVACIATINA